MFSQREEVSSISIIKVIRRLAMILYINWFCRMKWKLASDVLCDKNVLLRLKR